MRDDIPWHEANELGDMTMAVFSDFAIEMLFPVLFDLAGIADFCRGIMPDLQAFFLRDRVFFA